MSEKHTLESLLQDDSFIQWINGEASPETEDRWSAWVHGDPGNRNLAEQVQKLIETTDSNVSAVPDAETELKKLEHSLDRLQLSAGNIGRIDKRRTVQIRRAAAAGFILLMAVMAIAYLLNPGTHSEKSGKTSVAETGHELQTNYGEKIDLKLSDGSTIVLNANSHLAYSPSVAERQQTEVWLEGEAYFDITPGEQRVFRVHTADGTLEVLGTEFNVNTTSGKTEAVLQNGKVRIRVNSENPAASGYSTEVMMKPGELVRFTAGNGNVDVTDVDPTYYSSWTRNKWVFDRTPLSEITERIEDTFGVEVLFHRKELSQKVLSGSIKSTNLEILKEALSKLLHEPITQKDNTITVGS